MAKRLSILVLVLLGFTALGWSASAKRAGYGGVPAQAPQSAYAGSGECLFCHEEPHSSWFKMLKSRHVRRIKDKSDLPQGLGSWPFDQDEVMLAVGLNRRMEFVDHNWQLLPYSYNLTTRQWRRSPPRGQGRAQAWGQGQGGKGGGRGKGRGRGKGFGGQGRGRNQAFNQAGGRTQDFRQRCGECHLTAVDQASRGFVELNVGCESCHGPGRKHVSSQEPGDIRLPGGENQTPALKLCQKCHLGHHGFTGPITDLPGDFHQ